MNTLDHKKIDIRIIFILSIAAFINFSSPFYGSLFVLFFEISIISLIQLKYKKQLQINFKELPKRTITIPLLFLIVITISYLLSLFFNWGSIQNLYGSIRYLTIISHTIFCFYLSIYFIYNSPGKHFFLPICLSICFAVLVLFSDYNFNPNSVMNYEKNRLIIASNIRYLGYITMIGCLYCIISIILESNYKKVILFSFLFVVNFSLLFWLGGRGSILAFLISAVLSISFVQTRFTIKAKNVIYILGLIIISCIISIPFSVYQWNGLNRFFRLSQVPDLTLDRFSTGRVDLWIESVNLISKNILIGYGPEAHIFETKIGLLQPHNFVLQFLLEFGLLGCLLFLIILYYIIKKSLDNIRINCNINNLFCFSVIISIAIHGLYDGTLYHAPPIIIFCIGSAYIFSEFLKRNNILTKYQVSNVKTNEK